jgi:N-acetylglucosamine-6-phosphate deacetylase
MDMFDHGVKAATHIFNAMSGLAGRSPGVVGAIFESDSVFSSFIADGHHVHPANARLAGRLLGPTRLFLVSDGMPTLGSDLTEFEYQGLHITDRNGRCTTDDGTLAGTGIDILQACKNMSTWLDIDMAVALQMITSTPARVLGLDHRLGAIKPGAVADMVVLTEDYSVDSVVVGGQIEKPT